jgi:hypothetical protein
MKTCLIYGHDGGLDLCVTFNMVSFYRKLGFKVFFSAKLYEANILVVLRTVDKPIDLSTYHYQLIHVFDYLGCDYDSFVTSINHQITYIFCTSENKRQHIIKDCNFPGSHIFVALPPVETSLWISKKRKIKYDCVHVGNYKPVTIADPVKEKFLNAVSELKAHVWGLNWTNKVHASLYHGKAGLFKVVDIYAKSKFALGLMYPFQREVTYSSRFWLAPLNGCSLFSEPGLYTREIPGIIETDYSLSDIESKAAINYDRKLLMNEAKSYWEEQYDLTLSYVKPPLSLLEDKKTGIKEHVICIFLSFNNWLRKIYQKYSIFKIFEIKR